MPSSRPIRPRSKAGLSRAEFLVGLGLLIALAGVAYYPVSVYLDKAKINRAVEDSRTINTLLSQYAIDNNGVYPVGEGTSAVGKSEGIARNLLENNYAPNASVFAMGSTTSYAGKPDDYSGLGAANISWDFTAGATTATGITSAASDVLPTVYTTGENVTYPMTPGTGLDLPLSGKGPFGTKGIVVAYKGGTAAFLAGQLAGTNLTCPHFISKEYKDTATYTQIKP